MKLQLPTWFGNLASLLGMVILGDLYAAGVAAILWRPIQDLASESLNYTTVLVPVVFFFTVLSVGLWAFSWSGVLRVRREAEFDRSGGPEAWRKARNNIEGVSVVTMLGFVGVAIFQAVDFFDGGDPTEFLLSVLTIYAGPLLLHAIPEFILTTSLGITHPTFAQRATYLGLDHKRWEHLRQVLLPVTYLYPIIWVILILRQQINDSQDYAGPSVWIVAIPMILTVWPALTYWVLGSEKGGSGLDGTEMQNKPHTSSKLVTRSALLISTISLYLIFADYAANPTRFHLLQGVTWIAFAVFVASFWKIRDRLN